MERIPVQTLLRGLDGARSRFEAVRLDPDPEVASLPLFEALQWAASLDERFRAIWKRLGERRVISDEEWADAYSFGDTVKGVRFARNRVGHAGAAALHYSRTGLPRELEDPDWFAWRWRLASDLPGEARRGDRFMGEYEAKPRASRAPSSS